MADLLYGTTKAERLAQGEQHLKVLRQRLLRAPFGHLDPYAADHPKDCHTGPCRTEAKLREQIDAYMDAILDERASPG